MPITIASNISALQAGRRLAQSTGALRGVFEHLASGLRINRAADDAAGLAVADSLRVDTRVAHQGVKNLNDGLAVASIAESALGELSGIVIRLRELAEQASNGTLGNTQRIALDKEAQALGEEYFRIASTTEFNGLKLFNGSIQALTIQSGYGVNGGVTSSFGGVMGTGAFGAAAVYTNIYAARDAALADLNGDGHLDIAFAGDTIAGIGTTAIALGNGDGTFKAQVTYQTDGTASRAIDFGDVNGDGVMDMVTAGASAGGGVSTVRIGNGDGTFRHSVTYSHPASTLAGGVALADFNGDGALDMVSSGTGGGAYGVASVLLNRGDGTFAPAVPYVDTASGNNKVTVADLNRDGIMDIMNSGQIDHVFLGNGNGTFKLAAIMPGNATSVDTVLGDYNGDDILDLVTSNSTGLNAYVTFRAGRGDGTFQSSTSFALAGSSSNSVVSGDFNGDGALDFIAASNSIGPANVFLGNGNGTFKAPVSYAHSSGSLTMLAGDFSGDGVYDIVYGGYTAQNNFAVRLGNTQFGIGQLLPFSLRTLADARQSMSLLERAQNALVSQRGQIGALQSRLSTAASTVRVSAENYATAESQLRDADIAHEAAQLVRLNILQQAGAAVLAQANLQPRIALDLLGGRR